jgi:hypothetical protein
MFEFSNNPRDVCRSLQGEEIVKPTLFCKVCYVLYSDIKLLKLLLLLETSGWPPFFILISLLSGLSRCGGCWQNIYNINKNVSLSI